MTSTGQKHVTFDISGKVFKTQLSTLQSIPNSLLAELDETSQTFDKKQKLFYFDRDADSFKHILNAYRDREIHAPRDVCPEQFKKELAFFRIPIKLLAPCCWKYFYECQGDLELLEVLQVRQQKCNNFNNRVADKPNILTIEKGQDSKTDRRNGETPMSSSVPCCSNKLWLFLEEPTSSLAAKIWLFVYLAMVILSVFVVMVWGEAVFRVDPYLNSPYDFSYFELDKYPIMAYWLRLELSEHALLFISSDLHPAVIAIDWFCMAFFIIELIVHFFACPMKKKYLRDPYCIIKVILCVTMIVTLSLDLNRKVIDSDQRAQAYIVIRSISIMRLVLIFRLRKLYKGLDIMLLAIGMSLKELALLAFAFLICITVYGTMMFSAETSTNTFPNVWKAIWWALITMTTVGYGDFYPTTSFGYVVGTVCAINGIIVLAMPVALIASNFANLYTKHAELENQQKLVQEEEEVKLKDKSKELEEDSKPEETKFTKDDKTMKLYEFEENCNTEHKKPTKTMK